MTALVESDKHGSKMSLLHAVNKKNSEVLPYAHDGGDMSHILAVEARRCAVMLVGFVVALAHLHLYPAFFEVEVVSPDDIPLRERLYFHHGWTAMLVI